MTDGFKNLSKQISNEIDKEILRDLVERVESQKVVFPLFTKLPSNLTDMKEEIKKLLNSND